MKKLDLRTLSKNAPVSPIHEIALEGEGFGGVVIKVKEHLNMNEAAAFVRSIVDSVIDMDTMTYTPEFYYFTIDIMILEFYAGIPHDNCPLGKAFDLLTNTNLIEQVKAGIDETQLEWLIQGAEDKIRFLRNLLQSTAALKTEELLTAVQDMVHTGEQTMATFNTQEFQETLSRFNQMSENGAPEVRTNGQTADVAGNR